jgi:hypothetical protein
MESKKKKDSTTQTIGKENAIEEKNIKNMPLKHVILCLIYDWTLSSSVHGLSNIFRTKYILLKLIWATCLSLSIGYCSYLCVVQIENYFKYSVITTSTVINEAPTQFPAISICNLNSFDYNVLQDTIQKILSDRNLTKYKTNMNANDYTDFITKQIKINLQMAVDTMVSNSSDNSESKITYYGFWFEQMVITCKYQGIQCTKQDFYQYHNYFYGNCFRFNGGYNGTDSNDSNNHRQYQPIKESKKPGPKNGKKLIIKIKILSN